MKEILLTSALKKQEIFYLHVTGNTGEVMNSLRRGHSIRIKICTNYLAQKIVFGQVLFSSGSLCLCVILYID